MRTLHLARFTFITMAVAALAGCASNTNYFNSQLKQNLVNETWMSKVNQDSSKWTKNADNWYFNGEPNATEMLDNTAPADSAMSIMAVKVPQFTNINIVGSYQVQIQGYQDGNSVTILGTNAAIRQTSVTVSGNTLYVSQGTTGATASNLNNVIVRINVANIHNLNIAGSGHVEGRYIYSTGMNIDSASCGNVLLSGSIYLRKVNQTGCGTVSVIGANTPDMSIDVNGQGTVNVSGRVGVRSINQSGTGTVSVIGSDSPNLKIHARGSGTITVAGYSNLRELTAQDKSQVYLYWLNSTNAYISEKDNAVVGLAGSANNVNIDLANSSRLQAQYLHSNNVFIQTHNQAHANIAVKDKMFASATDNSSIYFFGMPTHVSSYTTNNSAIIPAWNDNERLPMTPMPRPAYKAETMSYSSPHGVNYK